jgi:hypothetical protein
LQFGICRVPARHEPIGHGTEGKAGSGGGLSYRATASNRSFSRGNSRRALAE